MNQYNIVLPNLRKTMATWLLPVSLAIGSVGVMQPVQAATIASASPTSTTVADSEQVTSNPTSSAKKLNLSPIFIQISDAMDARW